MYGPSRITADSVEYEIREGGYSVRDRSERLFRHDIMKSIEEIRTIIRRHQDVLAERYGVRVVGLFGSYVRGEQRRRSDVDLLAEILRPISLLELVGAELYLGDVLGAKVDLVPKRNVREELREAIFHEAIAI